MEIKNPLFLRITLILFFLIFAYPLAAQTAGYFIIDTENGRPRFVQRLVWSGGEYALRYEVVIQTEIDGEYFTHLREFTTARFIDVSLPPGEYRFQVIPYDVLNRPSTGSEWMYMEVLLALRPEVFDTLPEYFLDEDSDETLGFLLNVTGFNLEQDADIIIRGSDGVDIVPEIIYSHDGSSKQLFIENEILDPGLYEVIIRNPGGLEAGVAGIPIPPSYQPPPELQVVFEPEHRQEYEPASRRDFDPLKPMLIRFGAGWMPSIPIYGDDYGNSSSFLGAVVYAGILFYIPLNIHAGPEVFITWHALNPSLLEAGANLLAMKLLPSQRSYLGFRLGAAYTMLPDNLNQLTAGLGVSFHWYFSNMLFFEGGMDYSNLFNDISSGSLRPWLGVALQL